MSDFQTQAHRLVAWCCEEALPLWTRAGVAADGGFVERLAPDGTPLSDAPRRFRNQCRQVTVFSEAARRGWSDTARATACKGLDRTLSLTGWAPFRGAPYQIAPDGTVLDGVVDLYTHAFLLLALAHAVRLDHRAGEALDKADAVIAFMDEAMASPHGGWIERLPPALPRRQNPHMHLFEAFLALHEASGEARYLSRARDMADLFDRVFHRPAEGMLTEFFTQDWSSDPERGRIVEPGHMMEWAWLFDRYARFAGEDRSALILSLFERAEAAGLDPSSGCLIDEADVSGRVVAGSRRSWPQTEYVKAGLAAARLGLPQGERAAGRVIEAMLETYLGADAPLRGGWVDRYDAAGASLDDVNSASSFYHFMGAVGDAADAAAL